MRAKKRRKGSWTKRLVDLGKAHGGDVHWEQYEYDIGMTPEEALADFIEWTEEGEDA